MALLERLRAALHPDYDVEAPLAEGGMGLVFRARDVQLQRPVAIKVLRPELATATFRERFLREARTLAGFRHPHIVSVHRAGENDGLAWYAMDLLEGATLADRLALGPLPRAEALRITDQVLSALEAVHARGVVHRDIKPSNIFMAGGDAVVGDFGIAKSVSGELTALTGTDMAIGTPGYMPPEQATGGVVTARTDVCAVGMLLYHMLTGRLWLYAAETKDEWAGVPADLRPILARALAADAGRRYADAAEFRAALRTGRAFTRLTPVHAALAALVIVAAVLGWHLWPRPLPATAIVAVQPFAMHDGPAALGDSLAREVVGALRAAPELDFRMGDGSDARVALHVTGTVTIRGDSAAAALRVLGPKGRLPIAFDVTASRVALADSVARQLMMRIWTAEGGVLGAELPVHALPQTPTGLAAWATAELAYARAQWGAADTAYEAALALDSTCIVCDFRLAEISRWLRLGLTTARTGRLVQHVDSFPPAQQAIIRAWVDPGDRFGALEQIQRRWPDYAVGLFTVGDEFFHRGPLVGERRSAALEPFLRATQWRPDFAPAWEHLAWLLVAEGDRERAADALAHFAATASGHDYTSQILQRLIGAGYLWRFMPPAVAAESTERFLADPVIATYPDLAAGPLYLMSFDAPEGVVWLGRKFADWPGRSDLRVPGLAGQMMGLAALGRPSAAREAAARLRAQAGEPEYALASGALDVALALDDSLRTDSLRAAITRTLVPLTAPGAADPAQRRRAAWLLAVAARAFGDAAGVRQWTPLLADEPAPKALGTFLDAAAAADRTGGEAGARRALALTEPLLLLDSAGRAGDPLFRAVLHLARADWFLATDNPIAAIRALRWHENQDVVGYPGLAMQAAQFDWALGTWARWRRARILERSDVGREEACRAYDDVARLWQGGEGVAARRAGEAVRRRTDLACREPA